MYYKCFQEFQKFSLYDNKKQYSHGKDIAIGGKMTNLLNC